MSLSDYGLDLQVVFEDGRHSVVCRRRRVRAGVANKRSMLSSYFGVLVLTKILETNKQKTETV